MDNNKILEKVKVKIAISNVKEEDIVMNKRKLNIGKGIGIAACVTLSMTGVVLATTQIFNKFGANSSDGIQTAAENGYYSDINTEYKEANGIKELCPKPSDYTNLCNFIDQLASFYEYE